MNVKGHGNALAIAISVLALAVGGTGAAVAATSTVTISDPAVPGRVAHVDAAGRLTTVSETSTIAVQTTFANAGVVNLTSATSATLAITQLLLSETRQNAGIAGSDLTVRLVQNATDANKNCTTTAIRYISVVALSPGDTVDLAASAPIVIAPVGGKKYCLGIYSVVTNGAADATNYYPYVSFAGYPVSGAYTGTGTSATPAVSPLPTKKAR